MSLVSTLLPFFSFVLTGFFCYFCIRSSCLWFSGGSILLIMSRLDAGISLDAERAIADSIEELMSLTDAHIPPLLQRFQEYLPNVSIPPRLEEKAGRLDNSG